MLLPYLEPNRLEAGCDEAGRGCLAGAVYAAAVILPPDFRNDDLNDQQAVEREETLCTSPRYRARGDCVGGRSRYARRD